jgi:cell division protein FtsL
MIKKYKELIFTVTLIVLVIANVFFTVSVSASGAELTNIEKIQTTLASKNQELTDKITSESSLSNIGEKADSLGFTKPENIVYVQAVEPVAKLP